ncbi:hypothetical protein M8J76_015356 [Diaphorina citri]|nr:hypothetical protein M8J76_007117 [Diaphorina citri]KAI5709323.1 hypothetical protein M8J76_015356 [Diaphorina citri]
MAAEIEFEIKYCKNPTALQFGSSFWSNQFFIQNKNVFPTLYNLNLKYACIPATSVPSERVFSKTGQLTNNRRNRLAPDNLDKIIEKVEELLTETIAETPSNRDPISSGDEEELIRQTDCSPEPATTGEEEEEEIELIEMPGLANTQNMWDDLCNRIETTEKSTPAKKRIAPTPVKATPAKRKPVVKKVVSFRLPKDKEQPAKKKKEPGRISNEGDLSAIQQTQYRGTIFIVAEHGDHWHVLHDCTYTSSQCRNARVEAVTRCFGIRIKRRTIRSIDFNTSYATNVIYYLGRGGRKINYIQIGEYASRRGPGVEVGDLSDGKSAESGAQSVVETRTVENEMRIFLGCTDRGESGGAAEGSGTPLSNQPGSTHKRRKGDNKEDIASTKKTLPFPLCLPTLASMIVEFSISSVPRTFDQETSCSES